MGQFLEAAVQNSGFFIDSSVIVEESHTLSKFSTTFLLYGVLQFMQKESITNTTYRTIFPIKIEEQINSLTVPKNRDISFLTAGSFRCLSDLSGIDETTLLLWYTIRTYHCIQLPIRFFYFPSSFKSFITQSSTFSKIA